MFLWPDGNRARLALSYVARLLSRAMTSLVDISCWVCGARTRTTFRWLANQLCLVCEGCGESLYVNGPELARGLAAIEDAMIPIDEVTAELKEPLTAELSLP